MSDVAGYVVMCDVVPLPYSGLAAETYVMMPGTLHGRRGAGRERDRAQAHADLDADITEGRRYSYWVGEVRRVTSD